jgi:HemY protein
MLSMLRDLLFETGSWSRACEVQERITELKPGDQVERNRLAGARLEAARREPGELRGPALRSLTGDHPDFTPALLERARFLEGAGERRRAVRLLEKAVKRRANCTLLEELERLVPEDRRSKLAKLYAKLVTGDPANARLRLRAARYLIQNQRLEEAEQILRGLPADGESTAAHALWAELHEARADPEGAQQEYRQALAAQPRKQFVACKSCGTASRTWRERCDRCWAWDTFETG